MYESDGARPTRLQRTLAILGYSAAVTILLATLTGRGQLAVAALIETIAGIDFVDDAIPSGTPTSTITSTLSITDTVSTYGIDVPDAVPAGYMLDGDANIDDWYLLTETGGDTTIELSWSNSDGERFWLMVHLGSSSTMDLEQIVDGDYLESKSLNSVDYAETVGMWDGDTDTWDEGFDLITLYWADGEDRYELSGFDRDVLEDVAAEMDYFD